MCLAAHVCIICKARKKACDKALPRCGSCSKRGWPCSYIELQRDGKPSPNAGLAGLLLGSESHISEGNLDAIPYFQLCKVLRQTHLSVPRIGESYFREFHRTLPIICPTLFREAVAKYRGISPPADFSILLLALCLLTWNPSANSCSQPSPTFLNDLYVTVRILFARVQAHLCASTPLIQASLVIAAFEYASGQPRAANITLGTCARMILSIGLNIDKINDLNLSPRDRSTGLRDRESINLWWSAAIFERVILCDIPGCKQAPILRFPGPEAALPPDLSPEEDHSESIHFPSRPTLSELEAKNISGFGRQIQVTHLLDHLLSILINPMTNKQHHIVILQSLDQRIQMFMAVLICDCDHEWRYYCGAIGIATRSLFLLHEHIQTLHPSSDIKWLQKCSVAGLGFVTKVMVDVAHDHLERVTPTNAGALPLLCAYNLHAAIKQIKFEQIQKKANNDKDHNADLNSLLALDNICYQRWCKRP